MNTPSSWNYGINWENFGKNLEASTAPQDIQEVGANTSSDTFNNLTSASTTDNRNPTWEQAPTWWEEPNALSSLYENLFTPTKQEVTA